MLNLIPSSRVFLYWSVDRKRSMCVFRVKLKAPFPNFSGVMRAENRLINSKFKIKTTTWKWDSWGKVCSCWLCLLELNFIKGGNHSIFGPNWITRTERSINYFRILCVIKLDYKFDDLVILRTQIWRSDHRRIWLHTFVDHTEQFCPEVYKIIADYHICLHCLLASACQWMPVMCVPLFRYSTEQQGFLSRTFSKWFGY